MNICSLLDCDNQVDSHGYCKVHVNKFRKWGNPFGDPLNITNICTLDGCERKWYSKGYCQMHYKRIRRLGSPGGNDLYKGAKPRSPSVCEVDGCERMVNAKQMCSSHYNRLKRYGDPLFSPVAQGRYGRSNGYVSVKTPFGRMDEHRWIMRQHLGRPLLPGENVHHKNGIRNDNRIENLELWTTHQTPGQRVEDQIRFAREILAKYGDMFPESL